MKILGMGCALPPQVVTNNQLEQILDTSDEWIQSRTGIRERHILSGGTVAGLALEAGQEALQDSGLTGADLDMILVTTAQGDDLFPSVSCTIQQDLGANCPCMDLHVACAGFIYALDTADAYIKSGKASHILIVSAEGLSRLSDWSDRSTCVLFGDAAGAVVVGPGEGLLSCQLSALSRRDILFGTYTGLPCPFSPPEEKVAAGIRMEGQEVFKFAVGISAADLLKAADKADIPIAQMDWVLLHQANRRIIDAVSRRLGVTPGRVPSNIHRLGNTSSASIPLLMYDLYHAGLLEPGHVLALSGFGSGMVSGACILRWDKPKPSQVKDPVHSLHFT